MPRPVKTALRPSAKKQKPVRAILPTHLPCQQEIIELERSNIDLKTKGEITLAACMAHARRKFEKALDNDKARSERVLGLIQQLYATEAQAREQAMDPSQRKKLRQKQAVPVSKELEKWLAENLHRVTPKSPIGQAISYTINLWSRLMLYANDGNLEIDNNLIENQVRPLALGRKNYLFASSHIAAQRAGHRLFAFGHL